MSQHKAPIRLMARKRIMSFIKKEEMIKVVAIHPTISSNSIVSKIGNKRLSKAECLLSLFSFLKIFKYLLNKKSLLCNQ